MIKHIVMFKLMDAEGRTEYENAVEAQKRFENVIANVPQLEKGEIVINSKDAPQDNYTISLLCDFENIDDYCYFVVVGKFTPPQKHYL